MREAHEVARSAARHSLIFPVSVWTRSFLIHIASSCCFTFLSSPSYSSQRRQQHKEVRALSLFIWYMNPDRTLGCSMAAGTALAKCLGIGNNCSLLKDHCRHVKNTRKRAQCYCKTYKRAADCWGQGICCTEYPAHRAAANAVCKIAKAKKVSASKLKKAQKIAQVGCPSYSLNEKYLCTVYAIDVNFLEFFQGVVDQVCHNSVFTFFLVRTVKGKQTQDF